ncbi:MAG TPA: hypothetical protein VFI15_05755 [Candidatus Limnocylindrales bacterium]|nr:hypothetical protein [Candidatus Limnocylindrales bacterium]
MRLFVDGEIGDMVCFAAEAEGIRTALVWPNGWYSLPQTPEPIVDKAGTIVAHASETVDLGGGFSPGPWPQLQGCPDYGGRVFWVGDVTAHDGP